MTRRRTPTRRSLLASSTALLGGCLGFSSGNEQTSSADGRRVTAETDGYPPQSDETPDSRSVDTGSFERISVEGTDVPLVPVDVAHYWHQRRAARFADARGERSYEESHVLGAVSSPAPDGGDDDPVANWPTDDRIVTYCGCPHHLSSLRAASLLESGYERVYAIDEGFWAWHDRGYPVAGEETGTEPEVYEIRGRADARHAGETAWAYHDLTGQQEATEIDEDGGYLFELRFHDVSLDSIIRIVTPEYEVSAPLGDLIGRVVTGEDG